MIDEAWRLRSTGAFMKLLSRLSHIALVALLLLSTRRSAAADHPLEPLSAQEIRSAFEIVQARFVADAGLPHAPLRFPIVVLAEPTKSVVLGWSPGKAFPRHATLQVLHYPSNRVWVAEVDLLQKKVLHLDAQPSGTQPAIGAEEYTVVDRLVRDYAPWQSALRARGLDPALGYVDTWAAGDEPLPAALAAKLPFGQNTRFVRCLTFQRGAPLPGRLPQNPYARPVEGLVVTVDLNARQVIAINDSAARPVSSEDGNAHSATVLRPLVVQQPKGSDIQLQGRLVRWHQWQFYVALHPREGLVLYDVRYRDHGVLRPIAYRMALSEIYVPYGMGDANWIWRSALDVGEYNAGMLAQRLEVNRDVPENAKLLDATFFADIGPSPQNPTGTSELPATIALYERDAGLLWTRTDPSSYERDTRMARELVVTWSCWIGNYVYGFDWIFKLDGSIEVQTKLTGTTLNRGAGAENEASAPKVGKDARGALVAAPDHQHFLNFRLDLDVDGPNDQVMEMEVAHLPGTGFKNSFGAVTMRLDKEGYRDMNPFTARHWHVESAGARNQFGKPTGYALESESFAIPYSAPDFPGLQRAQFAQHQFWVTRYNDAEQYAAGLFPNQAKSPAGVSQFATPAEALSGQDVVVWFTIGFTHVSRPEDYPVMPTETLGFKLAPRGFFAQNPALDTVDQAASQ
jgi:primary-amine oxidase